MYLYHVVTLQTDPRFVSILMETSLFSPRCRSKLRQKPEVQDQPRKVCSCFTLWPNHKLLKAQKRYDTQTSVQQWHHCEGSVDKIQTSVDGVVGPSSLNIWEWAGPGLYICVRNWDYRTIILHNNLRRQNHHSEKKVVLKIVHEGIKQRYLICEWMKEEHITIKWFKLFYKYIIILDQSSIGAWICFTMMPVWQNHTDVIQFKGIVCQIWALWRFSVRIAEVFVLCFQLQRNSVWMSHAVCPVL